ncbi:hypothetical protein L1987_31715 [Smallanthus sonchifolius]|uniref:Uncharacterized protein n=1 Tax=Smallanthus sonchifolius TaxID=185202 RepID=A0ACB9I5R0_9ASTR|nr:hypothetical protein L1987_31715 [Smallanthus sonchifolius]
MKLPMGLSGDMPNQIDQTAKLESLAFMCTMIANLMPSLAAMDNKTLLANIIGLSILVITMINMGVIKRISIYGSAEKLRQHVRRYWIMAETGSPQFVMASNPLSTTSGVICVFVVLQNSLMICFSVLSFKLVTKWNMTHLMVFKTKWVTPPVVSGTDDIDEDLSTYILQIHDEVELAERTLACISNLMDSFILKAEKEQNKDLLELLEKSTGFKGVENFDTDATIILWNEVEHKCKWLDKAIEKDAFSGKEATEILNWFSDRAKEIVREINAGISEETMENAPKELIAANSMYQIAETILLRDEINIEPITKK